MFTQPVQFQTYATPVNPTGAMKAELRQDSHPGLGCVRKD